VYAQKGKLDEACSLLSAYTEPRLPRLHAAEQQYQAAVRLAQDNLKRQLEQGKAPGFDFQRYNRAGRAEQDQMLRDYVEARLKNDPSILAAGEAVRQEEAVVPVTLDLGLVLLRRAQAGGGAGRQAELEKAEKV